MKRKAWAKSFGPYGCTVRVTERERGGMLLLRIRVKGAAPVKESLGHRDKALAVEQARERQAQLALGIAPAAKRDKVTVGALLAAWLERQTELLTLKHTRRGRAGEPDGLKRARRAVAYWRAVLGADSDAITVTLRDTIARANARREAGAVDAKGQPVAEAKRKPVRTRGVGADLEHLRSAYRWALLEAGLIRENPLAGLKIAQEKNPRRPVASADRYDATRAVAEKITMQIRGGGQRLTVTSWLPELLDLAYSTGRRISAICALRCADVQLDVKPFGALVWRAESDKGGRESVTAIDATARAALDRIAVDREMGTRSHWPASPWLFPSPVNPLRPVSKDLASDWLERAEAEAKLPKLDGSLWHAYRRGWATARKHLPIADVAAVGGWKTLEVLSEVYQRPDDATSLRVVLEPRPIRG